MSSSNAVCPNGPPKELSESDLAELERVISALKPIHEATEMYADNHPCGIVYALRMRPEDAAHFEDLGRSGLKTDFPVSCDRIIGRVMILDDDPVRDGLCNPRALDYLHEQGGFVAAIEKYRSASIHVVP